MYKTTQLNVKGLLMSMTHDQSSSKKISKSLSKEEKRKIISLFIILLFYSFNKLQLSNKRGNIVSAIKSCRTINSRMCNNAKR
jgi:hypothetical protein